MRISDWSSDVCSSDLNPAAFEVEVLTANRSVARLAMQSKRFGARLAVVADDAVYGDLKEALSGSGIEVAAGAAAVAEAAARPTDWVMAAIDRKSTRLNSSH